MTDDWPTDELVDKAYELMSDELHKWQIVGPLVERRKNFPDREYWNAVRTEQKAIDATPTHEMTHLKDRSYAIACVQWHGLKAVLAALKRELAPLPASNDDTLTS